MADGLRTNVAVAALCDGLWERRRGLRLHRGVRGRPYFAGSNREA